MRAITSHKVSGLNEHLAVSAVDKPGPGGANHAYKIEPTIGPAVGVLLQFQNGPLKDTIYPTGLSNESLLAVLIDRMQGFQSGDFKCRENAIVLTHLEDAMHWMQHRTRERMARGVEGTLRK